MTTIGRSEIADMIEAISRRVQAEREALNRLDADLGDGDHGTSAAAGFSAAVEAIASLERPQISDIWLATAKALLNRMGGASGALFGSFFLKGVSGLRGRDRLSKSEMDALLQAGLDGVIARGKAQVGDKTMVDALQPAVEAFAGARDFTAGWRQAAEAARGGAESTRGLIARRGRAKFLKERAIGYIDPGAETVALLFKAIELWWRAGAADEE